ncbi:DUF5690 family protein [Pontibacter sp. 13R65]|uniref:DUF5690 family protein n=1 Tax=Pontibacter sp. 13R65 TaxID=3127458 RepID=UPI00301BDCE7
MGLTASISGKISRYPYVVISLITASAAFGCYTSMYAFRKAFTAGLYEEAEFLGINYKLWLISAQILGYMLSKFYGIRFISELGHEKRGWKIVLLISIAWIALLGFAIVPAPYNIVCMFLNGLPLGLIWGLVFSFLEGRRITEFLGAVMSISLVFASGFIKTVARTLVDDLGVAEYWMPFATGLLFVVPLLIFVLLLEAVPPPTKKDIEMRTLRAPMNAAQRRAFLSDFLPGIILTVFAYLLFTVLRDIRDNFQVEIWSNLGFVNQDIYAKTDSVIAIIVLALMSLLILVRRNFVAFALIHVMILTGCLLAGISTFLYLQEALSGMNWMVISGLGLYMAYIPYNAIFFERLIASYHQAGNIGFIMYVADSTGYLGSVAVLFVREFAFVNLSWTAFFQHALLLCSLLAGLAVCFSLAYFYTKKVRIKDNTGTDAFSVPRGEVQIIKT